MIDLLVIRFIYRPAYANRRADEVVEFVEFVVSGNSPKDVPVKGDVNAFPYFSKAVFHSVVLLYDVQAPRGSALRRGSKTSSFPGVCSLASVKDVASNLMVYSYVLTRGSWRHGGRRGRRRGARPRHDFAAAGRCRE